MTRSAAGRTSWVLQGGCRELSRVDARNDSQVIFYDQFVPDSRLVGYLNADHWAVAVPIARAHDTVGSLLIDRNAYPREALYEARLRLVEEDLEAAGDIHPGMAAPSAAPHDTRVSR